MSGGATYRRVTSAVIAGRSSDNKSKVLSPPKVVHNSILLLIASTYPKRNDKFRHKRKMTFAHSTALTLAVYVSFLRFAPTTGPSVAGDRKSLTVFQRPVETLCHFAGVVHEFTIWLRRRYFKNSVLFAVVVSTLAVYGASTTGGPEDLHNQVISRLLYYSRFVVWWVGLGILSSVGLGSGMHSGLLYVFPDVYWVCKTAEHCNNLDFENFGDMWWDTSKNAQMFTCTPTLGDEGNISFMNLLFKTLPIFILWGSGTAMGEIPPYAISYAARSAGKKNADMDEIDDIKNKTDPVSRMQAWMLDFMQHYDFWGIVIMAAWPNAAFDMCGIVCGHLLFSFWKFFGATLIGKGFMKAPMQCVFFTGLFYGRDAFDSILKFMQNLLMNSIDLLQIAHNLRHKYDSVGVPEGDGETSTFGLLWNGFMVCVIGYFVVTTIEQLAQDRANRLPKD